MTKTVALLCAVTCLACSANVSFRIDNPTDAPLTLSIDGKSHTVPPHADESVTLTAGKHTLETPAIGKVDIIVYVNGRGGLINPTLSEYIVANEIYATNAQTAKGFMKLQNKIVIGDEQFTGPFRVHNSLFIDQDWKYGAHDAFPESETVSGQSGGNIFNKVFAAGDFVQFYRRRYGVPEKLETAPPQGARGIELPEVLPHFDDPELEKAAAAIRDQYERYIVCTDPAEQKRLQEATSPALTSFITFMAPRMAKQTREQNELQNDFVSAYGHAFAVSARVLTLPRTP